MSDSQDNTELDKNSELTVSDETEAEFDDERYEAEIRQMDLDWVEASYAEQYGSDD